MGGIGAGPGRVQRDVIFAQLRRKDHEIAGQETHNSEFNSE
jgi:hypothetical protein